MKKLTITVTEQNENRKNILVEFENELADWLTTKPEDVQRDFILFEYKARCIERKETRRTQSLDISLDNGFDIADESADVVKEVLQKCDNEQLYAAMKTLTDKQYQILWLYAVDGLSFREIGDRMGVHKNSIQEYFGAAVKKLPKILQ